MTLPLLPPDVQEAQLDQQQNGFHQAPSEIQDRRVLSGYTLAEDIKLLDGGGSFRPRSRIGTPSCCHRHTTNCSQDCDSVYYHKITPRVTSKTKPKLQDGCIFTYFKTSPPKHPPTVINTTSAASEIGAETTEGKKVEDNTEKISPANVSSPKTVASEAALAEDNQDVPEPVAARKTRFFVPRVEHGNDGQWKKGVQLPTSDSNSEDNVRVRENLAYNLFIPDLEGNGPSPTFTSSTQEVEAAKGGEDTKAEGAPAEGPVAELSVSPILSSAAASIFQQLKPGSSSRTKPAGTAFENIPREAADKIAPLRTFPNLTKPDMSWAPNSPITFTSAAFTNSKGTVMPPRSARLRRGVPEQASKTINAAEPAFDFGKLDFWASTKPIGFRSSSSSSSLEHPIQTPSSDSHEDSPKEARVLNIYPKKLPEPEIPLQSQDRELTTSRAWSRTASSSDEGRVVEVQRLQARAEAVILKKQIMRGFWVKRVREIQEKTGPKAEKEERRHAQKAAAPVLSAAAKRRSRARRNAGGKSWAVVARA